MIHLTRLLATVALCIVTALVATASYSDTGFGYLNRDKKRNLKFYHDLKRLDPSGTYAELNHPVAQRLRGKVVQRAAAATTTAKQSGETSSGAASGSGVGNKKKGKK